MRIKSIFMLPLVALCLMACKKENPVSVSPDISGSYEGYSLASCAYFQNNCSINETVTITKNSDGTANIAFSSGSWGEFTVASAQVDENGGVSNLSGNGQTQMGMGGNVSSYDCSFTAVIKSKEDAQMQFVVPAVMGGMTIDFSTGEAPADLLLAGTYEGYTDADCAYFQDQYSDNESLTLTPNGDGTVALVFESTMWGKFDVASMTISKDGENYAFSGNGIVAMGMGEVTNNYDFTMTGITDAAKDVYSFVFNVPAVMGGLTITLLPGTSPVVVN